MKVTYLKPHNDHKAGDETEVPDGIGKYLIGVKVAEETKEKEDDENNENDSEKVEGLPDTEKKEVKPGKKKHITKP